MCEELPGGEFAPHFPGCAQSRGWCAAGPAGGEENHGKLMPGMPSRSPCWPCRAVRGEILSACPGLCSARLRVGLHEGAVECFGCCN